MTTATLPADAKVAALANALHLMNHHFGSKHTPADFMAQAAADLARIAAEPCFIDDEEVVDPDPVDWDALNDLRSEAA